MIYPTNFEQKIGFVSIRQMASGHCISQMGLEKVDEMAFSTDKALILKSLEQTDEFSIKSKSREPASAWRICSL